MLWVRKQKFQGTVCQIAGLQDHMPEDLRKWSGVNLDNRQRVLERLYPKLRRHRRVVDFWLDEVVFPVEAKCFPHKIASTGWDLCTHLGCYFDV